MPISTKIDKKKYKYNNINLCCGLLRDKRFEINEMFATKIECSLCVSFERFMAR